MIIDVLKYRGYKIVFIRFYLEIIILMSIELLQCGISLCESVDEFYRLQKIRLLVLIYFFIQMILFIFKEKIKFQFIK